MNRAGPGLLVRDLQKAEDPAIAAAVQVVVALHADMVLLTGIDFTITGNMATDAVVGSNTTPAIFVGRVEVSGTLSAFFTDATIRWCL